MIEVEVTPDTGYGCPDARMAAQVNLFVFDLAPEPLARAQLPGSEKWGIPPLDFTLSLAPKAAAISAKNRLIISFASRLLSPSRSNGVAASAAFVRVIE